MSALSRQLAELSIAERIQLVEDLWDSIADEYPAVMSLNPEQVAELQRRLHQHEADPASAISWEQVRAELFQNKT